MIHSCIHTLNFRRAGSPARRFPSRVSFPLPLLRQPRHHRLKGGIPTPADEILQRMAVSQKAFFRKEGELHFPVESPHCRQKP